MRQAARELDALNVRVLIVTFESRSAARAYVDETGTCWPVLSDESRALYRAYGMARARWRHLLGPSAMLAYAREVVRGHIPGWPSADPVQQGGDVLIDPAGIVRWVHVGAGPGHRPPVGRVLEMCRVANGLPTLAGDPRHPGSG